MTYYTYAHYTADTNELYYIGKGKGKKKTKQHKANLSKARKGMQIPSTWKQIRCTTTNIVYPSLTEAALDTGCDPSHIVKCCKGKLKQTKKKGFEYVSS